MNDTDSPVPTPNGPYGNFSQQSETEGQPAPVGMTPEGPQRSGKRKLVLWAGGIVLLAAAIVGGYFAYQHFWGAADTAEETAETTGGETSGVALSPYLLRHSGNSQGIAVGYVPKKVAQGEGGWSLTPRAAAAEAAAYEPVVFYTKDSNVYMLNAATKASSQLTNDGGEYPVFSSVAQQLAFTKSCEVYTKALGSESESVIELPASEGVCYQPIAWSPDGTKLALGALRSTNSAELGLVTLKDVYLYDTASHTGEKIDIPQPFNTVAGLVWVDSSHLIVEHQQLGQFAKVLSSQLSTVDISGDTPETALLQTNNAIYLQSLQSIESSYFALDSELSGTLLAGIVDSNSASFEALQGASAVSSYLLKPGASAEGEVFYLSGQAGTENSYGMYTLPTAGGTATRVHDVSGLSAYVLGWGASYDSVIYMACSTTCDIHLYDIESQQDEVIVPGLPLIQNI